MSHCRTLIDTLNGYSVIPTAYFHDNAWHESAIINKMSLILEFQLISILRLQVLHDYVCFVAP